MGIRTLHRRTAMAATVAVATARVTAAVVPVLFPPVPAVAARASTARLPAADRSPYNPGRTARDSAPYGPGPGFAGLTPPELADGAGRRRVRSLGVFTGPFRTHRVLVLSYDNPRTVAVRVTGVRAIERIARAVHQGLGRRRGPCRGGAPEPWVSEP
ncbi:hypothetical protein [Streptomyces sp. NPDC002580]|uniref:hypothetical protein n=1 Tax=Streptomyces sp. NPDC002580 TaxID=3364653 RepID=UPI0036D0802E